MLAWYAGSLGSHLQVHNNNASLLPLIIVSFVAGHVGSSCFSSGTGRIWMSDVQCTGSERALANCAASLNATYSCTHSQDVGVQCATGMMDIHMQLVKAEFQLNYGYSGGASNELLPALLRLLFQPFPSNHAHVHAH